MRENRGVIWNMIEGGDVECLGQGVHRDYPQGEPKRNKCNRKLFHVDKRKVKEKERKKKRKERRL